MPYTSRPAVAFKRACKETLASSVGWGAAAPIRRARCVVLAYHRIGRPGDIFPHVDVDVFREQMRWVRQNCTVLSPEDLRRPPNAQARPAVVVTFDDGYRDYMELAYPILKECDIPAANFISTQYVDDGGLFWWDTIHLAAHGTQRTRMVLPWAPRTEYHPARPLERRALIKACKDRMKAAPDLERTSILRDVLDALAPDPACFDIPRQVMNWDEIRATMDMTRYGGHTHTHVRVSKVEPAALEREIGTCWARLKAETGVAPTLFAYPIGDGSDVAKALLRQYGFDIAFSLIEGYVDGDVDRLDVHRFPGPASVADLAWIAAGWARAAA